MSFERMAGAYAWCADNHGGQGSRKYRVLSRIGRRGMRLSDRAWRAIREGGDPEWEEAHRTYAALDASAQV